MPVYNGMPYLPFAIESILNQTLQNFELIIVNDCSTDSTPEYLKSVKDNRVVVLNLSLNGGVTKALQEGLQLVKGEFIARLDADDIAKPDRLEYQVNFLRKNPQVGLLGTTVELIDENGNSLPGSAKPMDDLELRWSLLFKNPIVHSSVLLRTTLLKDHNLSYRLLHSEDYDLWTKLLNVTEGRILNNSLIYYRVNRESWTFTKRDAQTISGKEVAIRELNNYLKGTEEEAWNLICWVRAIPGSKPDVKLYYNLLIEFAKRQSGKLTISFLLSKYKLLIRRLGLKKAILPSHWPSFNLVTTCISCLWKTTA
jgi:glycosyltransferase involved in cell wall biosynthesis